MATDIQKGSSVLRPRARLIKTIGEELISNDVVAIIELVKNSYDADADIITITFSGQTEERELDKKRVHKVIKREGSSIIIYDDGVGMSLDTIQTAWMEPATIMKKAGKKSPRKSRRYTGEKGIGRFASAKLSSELQIVTKTIDDNEVVVNFNWNDFSDEDKYLDQVKSTWEVRKPIVHERKGTTLFLNNLNTEWDEEKFQSLKIALSRLVNPVAPVPDFLIDLKLPIDFSRYAGLIKPPESINKPDYTIKGFVDANGKADVSYSSKKNVTPVKLTKDLSKGLTPVHIPESGPFKFEFRVWDRESDSLDVLAKEIGSTVRNIRGDLDQLSGISIYRDNFRVLPYGEPKNDWLRLNARRVNNPTLRLSDNQVVGYIAIGLDENEGLKDQSNREGIVESDAFTDLQDQIKVLLAELEVRRYEERPRKEEPESQSQSLYAAFIIDDLAAAVKTKLPDDKAVLQLVKDTQQNIDKGLKKVQEVLARYRRLSTLGQLVDSILHDGGHFLLGLDSDIRILEKELNKNLPDPQEVKRLMASIQNQRKVIAQLFKRLEPFGGRKRGRPTKVVVEDSIKNVFEIAKQDIKRLGITIHIPDSKNIVTIDEGELQIILVNLLQNSLYWLETVAAKDRRIIVEIERNDDELSIVFSDSGPGIPENYQKLVFEPYFTTRSEGIGLGLTIVGELVSEYNGDFYLVNNGPLDGATFKIVFRRRI